MRLRGPSVPKLVSTFFAGARSFDDFWSQSLFCVGSLPVSLYRNGKIRGSRLCTEAERQAAVEADQTSLKASALDRLSSDKRFDTV